MEGLGRVGIMKILVVSLLRLGDIVMSTPVLRGLREQNPEAQIHLLINEQFSGVAELIPMIDRAWKFDRESIQKGLGDGERSVFESADRVRDLVRSLNLEAFDLVINLTQNKLSGWLVSLIEGQRKIGLHFDDYGKAVFGSPWFHYLNSQIEAEGEEVFHFTDIFKFALGVETMQFNPSLIESSEGRAEVEHLFTGPREYLAVQPLTSDIKKNWSLGAFKEALRLFHEFQPQTRILILGAPFEKAILESWIKDLQASGIPCEEAFCSFAGAFSLLKRAKLLLTGDTSVKHLAAAAGIPLLELSLGSSDYRRTGAYAQGSYIIQSKETCAPCAHSKPCHREQQFCASRIEPECVALVAQQIFTGNFHQLRTVAEEFQQDVEILRTEIHTSGFRASYSLLENFSEAAVGRWLDLFGRKLYLQALANDRDIVGQFGSESLRLAKFLRQVYPKVSQPDWRFLFAAFEQLAFKFETRITGFEGGLKGLRASYENPQRLREFVNDLISFRDRLRISPFMSSFKNSLDFVIEDDISPPFVRFRRIVDSINEIQHRAKIELKVIRTLQRQFEELT